MAHSYQSEYPGGIPVDGEIAAFFEQFYATSDMPGEHEKYVDMFAEDATFIVASKHAKGHAEILSARHGMWTAVASRKHTIPKIFPFGAASLEFMLHGTVALGLRNGAQVDVDWAGRAEVAKSAADGKYRMQFYQVYLDTGAIAAHSKS